jgi:hypothetical protein
MWIEPWKTWYCSVIIFYINIFLTDGQANPIMASHYPHVRVWGGYRVSERDRLCIILLMMIRRGVIVSSCSRPEIAVVQVAKCCIATTPDSFPATETISENCFLRVAPQEIIRQSGPNVVITTRTQSWNCPNRKPALKSFTIHNNSNSTNS